MQTITENPKAPIGVLGAGGWGTALAVLAAESERETLLWGREDALAKAINTTHENPKYLAGAKLPPSLRATTSAHDLTRCAAILVVVPSRAVRPVLGALADSKSIAPGVPIVACSKGIEKGTGKRMSEIAEEIFPENPTAVLSGPNHAEEIAHRLAAAAVIGCKDHDVAVALQQALSTPWFRFYTSKDVAGIEWSGAAKNVFAICAGIAGGLGLGDNAKAAMVTRGLAEMGRLAKAAGGHPETIQGLSGVGDLIVTCYSEHSRNNRFGKLLGQGKTTQQALEEMGTTPEGLPNTETIYESARRSSLRTPIIDAAYDVLYAGKSAREAVTGLLSRDPRPEVDA